MFDPLEALKTYIEYPSVSTDSAFKDGMEGARAHICGLLAGMGMEVESIETPLHPIVLASRKPNPDWPHVVIYGHYDVQPADPLNLWTSPAFAARERNGRLYGRGAADNKGPQLVHIAAAARLLEKYPELPLNLTFLIEGEEEIGSPSFEGFLEQYRERLQGDFVLLSDTLSPSTDQIAITTGLRGIVAIEVELTGPKMDLHSGIHGGAVINPLQVLSEVCASLHREDGLVNIPGFYDNMRPVEDWEREELKRLKRTDEEYMEFLGVDALYKQAMVTPVEATRFAPTLEFNGMGGGYQGEGTKTVIPSKAFAKMSCRLVPDMDADVIQNLVVNAIKERLPKGITAKFTFEHAGVPYVVVPPHRPNTPADQPPALATAFDAADKSIGEVFGNPALYLREGGSVPIIADLKRVCGLDSLMIGMFTPEDNLHAPDESMDILMFQRGIDVSEQILAAVAGVTV